MAGRPLENLIGKWTVPLRGVLRNTPIHLLPADALYDSQNVIVRDGVLKARPGMTNFASNVMTGRPTGAYNAGLIATGAFQSDAFQNDAFQMAGNVPASTLLVGTTKKIYAFFAGAFNDISNSTLVATDAQLARFAGMYHLSTALFQILHVNGVDTVKRWDTQAATVVDVPAAPTTMTDIASIADHYIGILPPYQVRWSNNQDFATWPAANVRAVSDKGDPLVAIRSMGQYSGVLYGTNSMWQVFPSGSATESIFYTFQNRGSFDGPAGTQAVVDANGVHYWMTASGRVGSFDGNQVDWVADGVWPIVDADMDTTNAGRIFGVYEPRFKEVWFFYPRPGDNGDCKGSICIVLPRPMDGIFGHIAFPMLWTKPLSAAIDLRLDIKKSLVFGTTGESDSMEGDQDRSATNFTGFWQTGLTPTQNEEIYSLSAFDTYVQRGGGFGTLNAAAVSSFILDTQGGTISATKAIDLTTATVLEPFGRPDVRGRFFGMKWNFTTPITLRFLGARLAADPRLG